MTQPTEAVGAATNDEPVIAAEPTIEDRFAALSEEPQEEEPAEEQPQAEPEAEADPELEAEDEDLPPITAPVSWPDEDKAAFSELPRALQERVSARETEREKFVQAKSREASQAAQIAESKAFERVQTLQNTQIQQLVALLPDIPEEPSAHLLATDPASYAAEMDYVRQMARYRSGLEGQIRSIAEQQQQAEEQQKQGQMQASIKLLQDEFPEYLDKDKNPDLAKALKATGLSMGYSEDQLSQVDGQDILAMRTAMGWKDKADKYDRLVAKQMEKVRAAKDLPRVSRPGSATGKGAVANQRYTADREAMRNGDRDAAARVFSKFL